MKKLNEKEIRYISIIFVDIVILVSCIPFLMNLLNSTFPHTTRKYLISTQQISDFNEQFECFKGTQTSSQVSLLIDRLLENSGTYNNDPQNVPAVYFGNSSKPISYDSDQSNIESLHTYVSSLTKLKSELEDTTYNVSFRYNTSGIISAVIINITPNGEFNYNGGLNE